MLEQNQKPRIHVSISLDGQDQSIVKEFAKNLAIDWQETLEKMDRLTIALETWNQRSSDLTQRMLHSQTSLISPVQTKISAIAQEMNELQNYLTQLENEVSILNPQSHIEPTIYTEHHPHEAIRMRLEYLLGEKIENIVQREKTEKAFMEKKADEDLAKLKKELNLG